MSPSRVDREHAVAVAVEGDAEVVTALGHDTSQEREVRRPAADVDVLPVGVGTDREDLGPELLEGFRRDARVGAVRAIDGDAEAAEVAPEALDDVLEVAVGRDADAVDRSGLFRRRRVEQRLDLLLGLVGQLAALGVEELDAVVLRRVVRRGDDRADVEGEQRHRGVGSTPARTAFPPTDATPSANASSSSGPDPRVSRPTNTRPRPDQAADARPSLLHEVRGQVLPDNAPDAVGAEEAASQISAC